MIPPLTSVQSREVDQLAIEQYGMTGLVLMENAGRGAAEQLAALAPPGNILILCGRGNNAGDGYVIARHLQLLRRDVAIVSLVPLESLSSDAAANAQIAKLAEIPLQFIAAAEGFKTACLAASTLVDCLLGTGAQGTLREPYRTAVQIANDATALRIAIDVPTGLDVDQGVPHDPTFRADHTITFVATKMGFQQPTANAYVGLLHIVGIGIPQKLIQQLERRFT